LTLGPIVHNRIPLLPVTRRQFPPLLGFDFDTVVLAARPHIVVVVEGNHTIVRFREGKKSYLG
jgi:hypothetical protein